MITDEQAEQAIDYLNTSARIHAQARAERIYMEQFRKTVKSKIMLETPGEAVAKSEARAYADPRYITHLEAMRTAIEKDEQGRFERVAAEARFEAWRTQESTRRAGV